MSAGPAPVIKSGPPIWLWIIMVPLTLIIIAGVVLTSLPEDPQEIAAKAQELLDAKQPRPVVEAQLAKLRAYPELDARRIYMQGLMESRESREVKAIDLFQEAFEKAEDESLKAQIQMSLGSSQLGAGQFQEAIAAFEKSIEIDPAGDSAARIALARLYAGAGALTLCENELNTLLAQDDGNKDAHSLRGFILFEQLQFEKAAEDFAVLLSTPGDRASASPEVIARMGECMLEIGSDAEIETFVEECAEFLTNVGVKARLQLATKSYEPLKSMLKKDPEAHGRPDDYFRAAMTFDNNELETASELITRACQAMPKTKDILELAAEIFKATKDAERLNVVEANLAEYDKAADAVRAAMDAAGNDVTEWETRAAVGDALKNIGDGQGARRWYAMAIALGPDKADVIGPKLEDLFRRSTMYVEFPKPAASKTEEPKTEEPKTEEPKTEEPKTEEPKTEEPKTEEPKTEEPKTEEPKTEEPKTEEPKTEEPKTEEPKTEEPKTEEPKTEEPKTEEPKTE